MVCRRCIKVVNDEFIKLNLHINTIDLGKVELTVAPNDVQLAQIKDILIENGFELIDDKKSRIIDNIKTLIIEIIHYQKEKPHHKNISEFIADEIGYDYSYLSTLFSSVEGNTIEKYIINQKLEKVKELLVYDELTLSEISYQLDYSSVQHLSNQFKKYIGLSPSHFKKVKKIRRKAIDGI